MKVINFIKATAKAGIKVGKAKSPTIFMIGGLVLIGAGTVWACYNTATKLGKIADEHTEVMQVLSDKKEDDNSNEKEIAKAATKAKAGYIFSIVKCYVGPVAVVALGAASICVSHNILNKRYLGACAALQSVTEAYSQYREKTLKEFGAEKVARLETELNKEKEENKKLKSVTSKTEPKLEHGVSVHFNKYSSNIFKKYQPYNLEFLESVQALANRRLQEKGYLFLNDVMDMLGGEKTELGCYFGWWREDNDFVDLGLDDPHNTAILTEQLHDENADWVLIVNASRCISVRLEAAEYEEPYKSAISELRGHMHRDGIITEDWANENK